MMRTKRRYIIVECLPDLAYIKDFDRELAGGMLSVIGQIRFHKSNPRVIQVMDGTHFILKVDLEGYEDSVLSLTMLKRLAGKECAFYTLKSSGTLKALRAYFGEFGIDTVRKRE
jgi:RNase P/RNase MRP subunit POP5